MYLFSRSTLAFYPDALRSNYEAAGTLPKDVIEVSGEIRDTYNGIPPTGKRLGINSDGMPTWVDIPAIPNAILRKSALATLSRSYQDDIEKLNRAWLAAAVNDGVNETEKKDVVLTQINTRKTQYASDRAAIIAQYPD